MIYQVLRGLGETDAANILFDVYDYLSFHAVMMNVVLTCSILASVSILDMFKRSWLDVDGD